jgi:hypothetical protein
VEYVIVLSNGDFVTGFEGGELESDPSEVNAKGYSRGDVVRTVRQLIDSNIDTGVTYRVKNV